MSANSPDWAERLRSGRYAQGAKSLREWTPAGDLFSADGVLADLLVSWGAGVWLPVSGSGDREPYRVAFRGVDPGACYGIPVTVLDRYLIKPEVVAAVMRLDCDGLPFDKIADYIEANP